jgi:hypothetical protein
VYYFEVVHANQTYSTRSFTSKLLYVPPLFSHLNTQPTRTLKQSPELPFLTITHVRWGLLAFRHMYLISEFQVLVRDHDDHYIYFTRTSCIVARVVMGGWTAIECCTNYTILSRPSQRPGAAQMPRLRDHDMYSPPVADTRAHIYLVAFCACRSSACFPTTVATRLSRLRT